MRMAFVFKKKDDYTEYPSLEVQDRVSDYHDSPVVLGGDQGSITMGADPNFGYYLEGVDDDDDWDLGGVEGREVVGQASVKRKPFNLQGDCRAKKQKVLTNVVEALELARDLLQSNAIVNVVPQLDVLVASNKDVATITAALDNAKARISYSESMETITVRRQEEILEEVKKDLKGNLCRDYKQSH